MNLFLSYTPKSLIPIKIFVHPYIPMILLFLANVGLWPYPEQSSPRTKNHWASPQTIIHSSTLCQPGFFILYFTVLGLGHVHEVFGEHTAYPNRADPWITSWSNWGPPSSFGIPRIHPPWLTLGQGSDTTCMDYEHHVSPHWYDIVHFGPKPSWICSWAISQNVSYQLRYLSILIYTWSSPLMGNVGLWPYTQQTWH